MAKQPLSNVLQDNDVEYPRGAVVWGPDYFSHSDSDKRPWVVLSNQFHPFPDQYVVMGITTRGRENSIEISTDSWVHGGLQKKSFVNTWAVMTLEEEEMGQQSGQLDPEFLDELTESLTRFLV